MVGSSLLIIYDERHIGAWLIDFAKCSRMEDGRRLTHRTAWTLYGRTDPSGRAKKHGIFRDFAGATMKTDG